ncbi:hypothetical protein WMY93_012219 [Mugilogobius chulae]|uniref:Uncharacterized protein n=1 Tax=Mugilogobius chulae TaxID=88201 RepID=A0AAW0PAX3_9GOBI
MKPSNSSSETTVTTATQTQTHSENYTHDSTTSTAAVTATANSSVVVTATSKSVISTQGSSSLLFCKCGFSQMILHELDCHAPLQNSDDLSTAEPDTLVISGGLYDEHPIYDNLPPNRQDEPQFHLEFLH